ncbi:AraC family transcriptional regulator [Thiospirochaeta perfilievii]|uniref:AraC family transcriptional regulator n=1 Tax=Thiospirochaeta perfilievii TaxID=252967 RepID=A0A5C1QA35_9SPIO|nr:helix-turn-helix transcriptional regulator [Thiospirochaeta perfilievii]QEN04341.1 AraC family transcriptional regulator [Thiospirochaeta perfilievii]
MDRLEIINETIKVIEREIKSLTSIEYVSNYLGYSKNYINRIFNSTVGITVLDYIKMRKITEGIREYKKSPGNIVDIAFEYGFNSHEVFIRNCKKYFNKVPGELIVDKNWSGLDVIKSEDLWFSENRADIVKRVVKLPELVLSKSDRGNIYIRELDFRGEQSKLVQDPYYTYKLLPKGVYLSFEVDLEDSNFIKYLELKYKHSSPIIEVRNKNNIIYYIKK